jgi:undecaprenyl pyrophosphate phosphatase UppP
MARNRFQYEKIPLYCMYATIVLMVIGMILSHEFLKIISKPDNVPIAAMLVIVEFFTWLALKQAASSDEHTRNGERHKIYEDMIR